MRGIFKNILMYILALTIGAAITIAARADDVTAEDVRISIKKAVRFLKGTQNKGPGSWDNDTQYRFGVTPLCGLALLIAGVPPDDPQVATTIDYVKRIPYNKMSTYSVSLRIMMLAEADPTGKKYRDQIEQDVGWLLDAQVKGGPNKNNIGGWGYENQGGRNASSANTSTSQFALLGLHEASRLGIKIPQKNWELAAPYWENVFVKRGGGFGYSSRGGSATGSMTCAGISSVIIVEENLAKQEDLIRNGEVNCCGDARESLLVQAAIDWLARSFHVKGNPMGGRRANPQTKFYYLYALERAGRLSGRRFIGAHDWYREGAEHLLKVQGFNGAWVGGARFGEKDPNIATALALLFLSKGKRPIVIGKYEHGVDDDWDRHPKGIHQLTRKVETQWNTKLNWQTINGKEATVDDLRETPVLFFSGRDDLNLNPQQKENLKKYIENGGFVFAEACQGDGCGNNVNFDKKFRNLMNELFPASELSPIQADHPVWNAHFRVTPNPDWPLLGLQACCRTSVIYCPRSLSCYWQVDRPQLIAQLSKKAQNDVTYSSELGVNVISYATGRQLRDKLDLPKLVDDPGQQILGERVLVLPKLEHNGGSDEAPNAWRTVLMEARQAGLRINMNKKMIPPTTEQLVDHPFVFMHGRDKFTLTEEERLALKEHLLNGGFLFADSICSSKNFTDSFRREIKAILPDYKLEPISPAHPLWNDERFGGQVKEVMLRVPDKDSVGGFREKLTPPLFEGIEVEGKLAVVFSPYDLSCALENASVSQCEGYTHADALIMARQALLYYLQTD